MSVDQDCSSEMAAMFGSSLALSVSDIPFDGPIAGVVVGRIDDQFVINPNCGTNGKKRYSFNRCR